MKSAHRKLHNSMVVFIHFILSHPMPLLSHLFLKTLTKKAINMEKKARTVLEVIAKVCERFLETRDFLDKT